MRRKQVPQEHIPILLGDILEPRAPATGAAWEILSLAARVDSDMML
jgi:hypothetical protein